MGTSDSEQRGKKQGSDARHTPGKAAEAGPRSLHAPPAEGSAVESGQRRLHAPTTGRRLALGPTQKTIHPPVASVAAGDIVITISSATKAR